MKIVFGTTHIILSSEKIFLICKTETQIRNCYLLIALGTADTDNDKTKPCFRAIPSLSPSESLPWTQASVLGMFYRAVSTSEGHGISLENTHLGEYLTAIWARLSFVILVTKLIYVLTVWRPWQTSLVPRPFKQQSIWCVGVHAKWLLVMVKWLWDIWKANLCHRKEELYG